MLQGRSRGVGSNLGGARLDPVTRGLTHGAGRPDAFVLFVVGTDETAEALASKIADGRHVQGWVLIRRGWEDI